MDDPPPECSSYRKEFEPRFFEDICEQRNGDFRPI